MEGLDRSTEAYLGQTLEVRPFYGYGWSENRLVNDHYVHFGISVPLPFAMQLIRLWSFLEVERRGGVGRVATPGHPFDQFWVVFSTRHLGEFNFNDKQGHYNLDISPIEPSESTDDGWPRIPTAVRPEVAYAGWAEIEATHGHTPRQVG